MKALITTLLFVFITQIGSSQQTIKYDNKNFEACEVIEGSVSDGHLSVYISQHELREGHGGKYELAGGRLNSDNINLPKNLGLLLEVEFKNGAKFPIEEKDSVFLNVSILNKGYSDDKSMMSQIKSKDHNRIEQERKKFKSNNKSIEEPMKVLAKQFKEGKISSDEFGKKLKELSDPLLKEVNESYTNNIRFNEPEDVTAYSINFTDTYELIDSRAFSGTLYIKRFNEKEFVASFRGNQIVECLEKRAASSKEEEKKCKTYKSQLMKGFRVLKEGFVEGEINVKLKKFEDFR